MGEYDRSVGQGLQNPTLSSISFFLLYTLSFLNMLFLSLSLFGRHAVSSNATSMFVTTAFQ